MNKIRIAAAIASEAGVTLYLVTGKELVLPKDGYKTKAIMDQVLEPLARKEIVEIDLDDFSVEAKIEKKTNGFVRFFKETFSAVKGWIMPHQGGVDDAPGLKSNEKPVIIGEKPVPAELVEPRPTATPAVKDGTERIVAVVAGKRIEHVEHLEKQMRRAVEADNVEGFKRFMERIASVVDKRKHSVDELLNFMSKADLPIADDGSIVAYKVLNLALEDGKTRIFADCHTGKVVQMVGSHVSMPDSLVDDSRRTQCSTGLHIARRKYLSGFPGSVITVVKVAPEDVIAVPYGEPDKMRAAAYHIVAELPEEVHSLLRSNKPMTSHPVAAKILADVIAGNHIGIIEHVKIGGPNGTKVTVTKVADLEAPEAFVSGEAKALDDGPAGEVIALREVRQAVDKVEIERKQTVAETPVKTPESVPDASTTEDTGATLGDILSAAMTESQVEQETVEDVVLETQFPSEPAAPVETAQERRNRIKRERRAAEKAIAPVIAKAVEKKVEKIFEPTPAPDKFFKEQAVLKGHAEGKSLRTLEKELGMCRKTMRKIIDKHNG